MLDLRFSISLSVLFVAFLRIGRMSARLVKFQWCEVKIWTSELWVA